MVHGLQCACNLRALTDAQMTTAREIFGEEVYAVVRLMVAKWWAVHGR